MTKVRFHVIGNFPIVGTDGKDVTKGGVVELDDSVINVRALVEAGHVKPMDMAKPAKTDKGA